MAYRLKRLLANPELLRKLAGLLAFMAIWYVLTGLLQLPRFNKIPDPVAVLREWLSPRPVYGISIFTRAYYLDMLYSVARTYAAFILAVTLGVSLGLVMGWSRLFFDYSFPLVEILRPMPPLSWIPLAVLILPGIELPVVFVTFIAAFFATVLNTLLGVLSIDESYFRAARCLGSRPKHIFLHVVVPGALPYIFTGLQIAMGVAWMSLVAGEIISGQRGLGYMIYERYSLYHYSDVVIGMGTLGLLGYGSSAAVRALGNKLMAWRLRSLGEG